MNTATNRDSGIVAFDVFFFWVMDFRLFIFTLTTNTQHPILRNVGLHSPKDAVTPVKTRILRNTAVR